MQAATCVNEPDRLFGKQIEATNQVLGTPTCHMFTPKVPPCPACPLLRAGPLGSSGAGPGCVCLAPANCLINSCAEQGRKKENPGEGDIFHAAVSKAAVRPAARADPVRPICPRRTKRAARSRDDCVAASPAQGAPRPFTRVCVCVCVCISHGCVPPGARHSYRAPRLPKVLGAILAEAGPRALSAGRGGGATAVTVAPGLALLPALVPCPAVLEEGRAQRLQGVTFWPPTPCTSGPWIAACSSQGLGGHFGTWKRRLCGQEG